MEARKRAMLKRKKLRTLGKSRSTESEDEEEEEEGKDMSFLNSCCNNTFKCIIINYNSSSFYIRI